MIEQILLGDCHSPALRDSDPPACGEDQKSQKECSEFSLLTDDGSSELEPSKSALRPISSLA